jgi:hypothetical protein
MIYFAYDFLVYASQWLGMVQATQGLPTLPDAEIPIWTYPDWSLVIPSGSLDMSGILLLRKHHVWEFPFWARHNRS